MNFDFSDEQRMLRDQSRRLLSEVSDFHTVRQMLQAQQSFNSDLWQQVAEMGWPAVAIGEEQGGLGLGMLELCVLAEELGRTLAPIPFQSTVLLAAELLKFSAAPEAQDLLQAIASGEAIVAAGLVAPGQSWADQPMQFDGKTLTGRSRPLAYAAQSHYALLPAQQAGRPVMVLVKLGDAGLQPVALNSPDEIIPFAALQADGVSAIGLLAGAPAIAAMQQVVDQSAILTAFEQIGGAEAACELARNYALERHTFGRPIGSYQAIKHKLADMSVKIELARSNAYYGAWALHAGSPQERALAAATCRLSATEAFEYAARECLHIHGGIGYTSEADCHFFYKRSRLLAVTLGEPGAWVDQLLSDASLQLLKAH
ncbi:acyl-CoA dehydrogenase [Pseudomonas sp. GM21]|uniref:acyl-CoA dehydrogenase family protein n=1 Tax=Pseudomonas sp. GM21 TaxID=1144325 RepID=UPI0002725ECB|nr:acyl-CoA dehydrogenase family protein [Pseudomonas sp. GM21]EJM24387.1 acyl-CoA dehydrogenase [Pseudomonas sp. GM21]